MTQTKPYPSYLFWYRKWSQKLRSRPEPTSTPIFTLPNELLLLLSKYSDLKDIHSLRQTHRRFALLLGPDHHASPFGKLPILHSAALKGEHQTVQYLLDFQSWPYVNKRAAYFQGKTALYFAALTGNELIVRMLLESGAGVNKREKIYGKTALHIATLEGHESIVRLLLERGAKVNYKDYEGRTALIWAARSAPLGEELVDVFQLLLAKGADLGACDAAYGATVLHWAASKGRVETVKLLLDNGANVSARTLHQEGAIDWASKDGNVEVVRVLMDKMRSEVDSGALVMEHKNRVTDWKSMWYSIGSDSMGSSLAPEFGLILKFTALLLLIIIFLCINIKIFS